MRIVISKFLKINYQSGYLGEKNQNKFFSIDERLINYIEGQQVWLIEIIDNIEKDFLLEAVFNRDESSIKKYISMYIETGNNICSDGWATYNYLDNELSGYHHYRHVHGGGCICSLNIPYRNNLGSNKIQNKRELSYYFT